METRSTTSAIGVAAAGAGAAALATAAGACCVPVMAPLVVAVLTYRIEIANEGEGTVQLLRRRWVITDALGQIQEVEGPGVVGEQPVLGPGETFEYTSACPLATPFGSMQGSYQMITEAGETFDAEVAPFSLAQPNAIH